MTGLKGLAPLITALNMYGTIMTLTELSDFLQVSRKVLVTQYEKGNLKLYFVPSEGYQILTRDVIKFLEKNYNLGDLKNS
ncbi:MAG: hypothetical protein ACRCVN_05070 [Spirochaetia bacterium]